MEGEAESMTFKAFINFHFCYLYVSVMEESLYFACERHTNNLNVPRVSFTGNLIIF